MKRLPFAVYLMAIVSCYNGMPDHLESDAINQVEVDEVIPVDVALQTLEEFMNDNDLCKTRSGAIRNIASVEKYYSMAYRTRADASGNDLSSSIPTAYIVNFDNQEGFAVLGAKHDVPDIVAVTESGSINPVTLAVTNGTIEHSENISSIFDGMDEDEINEFNKHVTITEDSLFYSIDDEDYFDALYNGKPDSFTSILIEQALEKTEYFEGTSRPL